MAGPDGDLSAAILTAPKVLSPNLRCRRFRRDLLYAMNRVAQRRTMPCHHSCLKTLEPTTTVAGLMQPRLALRGFAVDLVVQQWRLLLLHQDALFGARSCLPCR